MIHIGGITLLILLSGLSSGEAQGVVKAVPAYCQPWRVPIEVDTPQHNDRPYYVEMHRCLGQCTTKLNNSPLLCECAAATTQDVILKVTTTVGYENRVFKNHTSCKSQCRASYKQKCLKDGFSWNARTCTCNCLQPLSGSCPQNQVWNTRSCRCECPNTPTRCSSGRTWNQSTCSCQCSVTAFAKCSKNNLATDMRTCRCTGYKVKPAGVGKSQSNESETKLIVSLVAIGLLLGTLFVIDLVLMCSKKGFMYGLVTKCSEKNGNREYINGTEAETGSIRLDIDYATANGNCKHKLHSSDVVTSI